MKKIILSVAILGVLFTGCKKKDDDPAPSSTSNSKTTLLTAHNWYLVGVTADKSVDYDGDGNSSLDVYSQMDNCDKDDFFTFSNANNIKSGAINEGANACGTLPPNSSYPFTWVFNSTETILTITINESATDVTIIELNENTLKMTIESQDENGKPYLSTQTYSKTAPVIPVKSKTELLTAHSWITIQATADKAVDYDGDGNSSTNVYSQYADCDKDDFISFTNNNNVKSGAFSDGANSCFGDPNTTYPFTWEFNSTESILKITSNGQTNDATILELTDTKLKISYETEDDNGLSYIQTDTYVKK